MPLGIQSIRYRQYSMWQCLQTPNVNAGIPSISVSTVFFISEPDISISINLLKMDSMSNYILKSFGKIKKYVSKLILQKNIIKYYIIL